MELIRLAPMGHRRYLLTADAPLVSETDGHYLPICLRLEHVLDHLGGLVFDPVYTGHCGQDQAWAKASRPDEQVPTIGQINGMLATYKPPLYHYHIPYAAGGYVVVECEQRLGPMARHLIAGVPGVTRVSRLSGSLPEGAEHVIAGLGLPTGRTVTSQPEWHFAAALLAPESDPVEVVEAIRTALDV